MSFSVAFCMGMMLAGILLGEIWFGAVRPGKPLLPRDPRVARTTTDRGPSKNYPPPPDEPGAGFRDDGKPAPLQPKPGHHLVAANALPPSEDVYLLPKD